MNKLFDLYMKYGEDYRTPCEKYAIDTLNDAATKYDANSFFSKTDVINAYMKDAITKVFEE